MYCILVFLNCQIANVFKAYKFVYKILHIVEEHPWWDKFKGECLIFLARLIIIDLIIFRFDKNYIIFYNVKIFKN